MNQGSATVDLTELEKVLPPIVFRNWRGWRDVMPMTPGSLANMDAMGQGPEQKIMCGRVVGYPRAALIEWLRRRSRFVPKKAA